LFAKGIKNVLILHSYHQGLQWTDHITQGIVAELADISSDIELFFEHLDTKRNFGKSYSDQLVAFNQYKIKLNKIKYSLIICSDNNALNYVIEHGEKFYPGVPVVFCGINNFSPDMLKNRRQITGVIESVDYRSTLALIQRIHPDRKNIVVVLDKTPTGEAIKKEFLHVAADFIQQFTFDYYQDFLLEEVPEKISTLGSNDIIYIFTFNRDRAGHFISYIDGIRMIRKVSKVPIYGSWDFYFGNGIVGGMITSGYSQGQAAARMAKRILSGESADNIPVMTESPNQYMFDFQEMQAFGIKKSQVPKNSHFIHLPIGGFERYKNEIIFWLGLSTLLVLSLLWRLWVQYQRQKRLKQMNQELDLRVAEKTAKFELKNKDLKKEIIERIKLEKEIRKLAATDPLTNLSNRRSFIEKASAEFSRSHRYNHSLAILMMDIDHFKRINDTYGHHIGDVSLKSFASVCMAALRKHDLCGRLGGEEFAIILIETDMDEACQVAERLRQQVACTLITEGNIHLQVQVSIGVTQLAKDDVHVEHTIQRADKAMYMAKDNGRNQVVCL
jgi:diguanylate cyclase (GGDEF)-like protein